MTGFGCRPLTTTCLALCAAMGTVVGAEVRPRPFCIQVVDEQTGRGVPLVELETTNNLLCVTDSNGIVAFDEPGLMDREVFFHVRSHGYEYPADGFGYRGKALRTVSGGSETLRLKRLNLAERLYRVTGQGLYRDSVLVGRPVPIREPLLNGQVVGQDTVMAVVYRGRVHWFWGDTGRPGYPLGLFKVSGATSALPGQGGLDPDRGVDLEYFVGPKGFSRAMCPIEGEGAVWIDGLMVLPGQGGQERLAAHFVRMKSLGEMLEQGLVLYNDATEAFEKLLTADLGETLLPRGQAFRVQRGGQDHCYFTVPYPCLRVRADLEAVKDRNAYEAFTCLAPGARYDKAKPGLDRDAAGTLRWAWKAGTDPLTPAQEKELIQGKHITPDEAWYRMVDAQTGKPVQIHAAAVAWNEYRQRWIMIGEQFAGESSLLGELYYAEAEAPEGPWLRGRRVVTHDRYTFYNPALHPCFDQEGGRLVYFEATYTAEFSGNPRKTPRYDYNQIMYRLDLADARLRE
jgi:hypothetical protein